MESSYKPSGWLGALMGTRLYFDMSDARRIPAKIPSLIKELGDDGKLVLSGSDPSERNRDVFSPKMGSDNAENWSFDEVSNATELPLTCQDQPRCLSLLLLLLLTQVEDWLKRIKCAEYCSAFRLKDMDGMALSGLLRMAIDARLVHEVLAAEFGMKSLGQRLRMVEELHKLFS